MNKQATRSGYVILVLVLGILAWFLFQPQDCRSQTNGQWVAVTLGSGIPDGEVVYVVDSCIVYNVHGKAPTASYTDTAVAVALPGRDAIADSLNFLRFAYINYGAGEFSPDTGSGFLAVWSIRLANDATTTWQAPGDIHLMTHPVRVDTSGQNEDKTGYALQASQTFNNSGTWTGNLSGSVTGSVASVTNPVTVGTNNDKTGYSISGTLTTLDGLSSGLSSTHGAGPWATATGFSVFDHTTDKVTLVDSSAGSIAYIENFPNAYKADVSALALEATAAEIHAAIDSVGDSTLLVLDAARAAAIYQGAVPLGFDSIVVVMKPDNVPNKDSIYVYAWQADTSIVYARTAFVWSYYVEGTDSTGVADRTRTVK